MLAEAKAYKGFFEWCDDAAANKGFEIKTASAKKEDCKATIEKATSDISEGGIRKKVLKMDRSWCILVFIHLV